nr:MAG TPA: hypothetical protein [Caudoviricetes sp.]
MVSTHKVFSYMKKKAVLITILPFFIKIPI